MIGIYSITNKINGKRYIGQSIDIDVRIKRHFRELRKGIHHCKHLQRAYDKYGEDSFTSEILCQCEQGEDLDELEKYYISKYNSYSDGYNLTLGGKGDSGLIVTDEFRQRMSDLVRGSKNPNYGNKWTKEMKENLSKKLSSGARKGKNNSRAVKVIRVEDCVPFDYMEEAAKSVGLKSGSSIIRCLKNKSYIAGGYHWTRYSQEMFEQLSDNEKRFKYLCDCYLNSEACTIIADINDQKFYTKHEFIKLMETKYSITERKTLDILKTEKIIKIENNVYQLLVA